MANDAVVNYEKLAQDAMDDQLPRPTAICKDCTETGVPFSLNAGDGPRDADRALGIPSNDQAATEDWFLNNPWIRDRLQNFRDTFLLRVLLRFGELKGEAYMAEFYAFIAAKNAELTCIDNLMVEEDYVTPPFIGEIAQPTVGPDGMLCDSGNFRFHDQHKRIYYWTFTAARYSDETPIGSQGQRPARRRYGWALTGQYDVTRAANDLAAAFERQKLIDQTWNRIFGFAKASLGVLSIIPAVRVLRTGAGGIRYAYVVLDAALSANAIASGSTSIITGEGIDLGETMFASLGSLVDPQNGDERGRQVFMYINLAMLAPAAFGGARWVTRRIWPDGPSSVRYDVKALPEAERKRLNNHASVEPRAIELHGSKHGDAETGRIEWFERPSLDTNRSQVGLTTATDRANYAVMTNTLRSRLAMLIHNHGSDVRSVKNLNNVIGDAGEEAMVAAMVEKMGFKPENILGYSPEPGKIPHRIGLSNGSKHGLDVLVYVPPPPSLTVRNPGTDGIRNGIDGAKRPPAPTTVMAFEERTLLVIETKSTLDRLQTPKFNPTQTTGPGKVDDVLEKIRTEHYQWRPDNLSAVDPDYNRKYDALVSARDDGNIAHLHAQIFFDSNGQLNKIVGNGTGIQLNSW